MAMDKNSTFRYHNHMTGKLNDKQKLFVLEYLKDLNATQAAIRAGYSEKTARQQGARLLTNAVIEKQVEQAKAARQEAVKIDAAYVLKQAVKLHERCMQEVRPKMVRQGKEMVHATDDDGNKLYVFDTSGAAKGLELIGKHISVQAFNEKKSVTLDLADASTEELEAELARLEAEDD
jgi:phage terminase small subunit